MKDMVIFFMDLCARLCSVEETLCAEHYQKNLSFRLPVSASGYLEEQGQLGAFFYGEQRKILGRWLLHGAPLNAAVNACEVMAVFNVCHYFGEEPSFPELLSCFERSGCSLYGYFGTSLAAVEHFFVEKGYEIEVYQKSGLEGLYSCPKKEKEAYLLTGYNVKGRLKEMIHTICVTKERDDFWAHNDYEGSRHSASLAGAAKGYHQGKGEMIYAIRILGKIHNKTADAVF